MMRLLYAPASPFARKARLVVLEKGLDDRVELVVVSPMEDPPALHAANPLGKVPALVLDDGACLYDSPVICAYLDSLTAAPALHEQGAGRWPQARTLALVDGLLDAAVAMRMEGMRPAERQWTPWVERQQRAIRRALDVLEQGAGDFGPAVDMVQLACGAALEYLDFRLPDLDWRSRCPRLHAWLAAFARRPAMQATRPA